MLYNSGEDGGFKQAALDQTQYSVSDVYAILGLSYAPLEAVSGSPSPPPAAIDPDLWASAMAALKNVSGDAGTCIGHTCDMTTLPRGQAAVCVYLETLWSVLGPGVTAAGPGVTLTLTLTKVLEARLLASRPRCGP